MEKKVIVRSDGNYWSILRTLGKLGELRVEKAQHSRTGASEVTFRERTFGEWLKEKFSSDKSASRKAREKVFDALVPLIKGSRSSDQLLQNIRDRIDHDVGISGRALKRDFTPVDTGGRAKPLQGGTTAAISKGNSVQLLEGDPAKIKCSHAVLQTSTAITEASRHPKLQDVQIGITSTSFKVDVAATSWSCITNLRLPELQSNQATISTEALKNLLIKAVEDQSGAVVIEVIPDHLEEHSLKQTYSYTDEGLRKQIQVAAGLVAKAKQHKRDLVITFACKDVSVLERMRKIHMTDTATKKGTTKKE